MNYNIQNPPEEIKDSTTPTQYDEIELISQGAYGCIFRPDIPCEKSLNPNKKYISKIQLNDVNITNEFSIGEQIQTIPLYYLYFSPILSKCIVSIQQLTQKQVEKCDILKDRNESETALISTKIKYVGNKDIEEYLLSFPQSNTKTHVMQSDSHTHRQSHSHNPYKSKLLYCLYYVLQSAKILNEKGIIHFDIKEKNIMYDEYIQAPLLIDFGLSFIPQRVTPDNISNIFYTKQVYPYWCIEVFILSYIVNRTTEEIIDDETSIVPSEFDLKNTNVSETKIDELLRTYQDEMEMFFEKYMNKQFAKEEIQNYMKSIKSFLMQYDGTSWKDNVYNNLFIPQMYNTWDIYSIAITFSCILNVNEENISEYKPLIDLLKSIIFAVPGERPDYNKLMENISAL